MWAFTTHGFLSIVQHNAMPDHFQVKARVPDPLEKLWPEHKIEIIDWADYRYRITIGKSEVLPVLLELIASVDYTSFKGCLLYTSPSPRDKRQSRMPSSA